MEEQGALTLTRGLGLRTLYYAPLVGAWFALYEYFRAVLCPCRSDPAAPCCERPALRCVGWAVGGAWARGAGQKGRVHHLTMRMMLWQQLRLSGVALAASPEPKSYWASCRLTLYGL